MAWFFTDIEKDFIIGNCQKMNNGEIGLAIGKPRYSVRDQIKHLKKKGLIGDVTREYKRSDASLCWDCKNAYVNKCDWIGCGRGRVDEALKDKEYQSKFDAVSGVTLFSIQECPKYEGVMAVD